MIKDIVVNLSVREGGTSTADYAVSVASTLEAHIAGIAFAYDVNIPMSELGYNPRGVMDVTDALRRDNEAAAKAAIERFAAATARAGVSAEPRMLSASYCQRRRPVQPHRAALRPRHCRPDRPRGQRGRSSNF